MYSGNFSVDGRNIVLVWTSVIPRLVWKLGKEGDEVNVSKCFKILYMIVRVHRAGVFPNLDEGLLEKHFGMLVSFFYTKASVRQRAGKNMDLAKNPGSAPKSLKKYRNNNVFKVGKQCVLVTKHLL